MARSSQDKMTCSLPSGLMTMVINVRLHCSKKECENLAELRREKPGQYRTSILT
jgi:hypothetical protein